MANFYEEINDIMTRFDFKKVQRVMEFLNWRWGNEPVTEEMLRSQAMELLDVAVNNFHFTERAFSTACGGLVAQVEVFDNSYRLSLSFYVDQCQGIS